MGAIQADKLGGSIFMHLLARFRQTLGIALIAVFVCVSVAAPLPAIAGTTGTISGTITDSTTGAPVSNASVSGTSPSGSLTTTTDSKGFYVLQNLTPDTYTVSVTATNYASESIPGVIVQQDLASVQNFKLSATLTTIAHVATRSSSNLVKPDTTSDTYTVSGAQLNAISGGNDTHKTLYQYIAAIPGITGSGFPAQPRVHGGSAADISYEFDGIPINENITGLFTTNLSNVGIGNIEVSTGGLSAANAASGIGIINTIAKTGTYPGFGDVTYTATPQYRNIYQTVEFGGATQDKKLSWFFSLDNTNALNEWQTGQTLPDYSVGLYDGPGVVKTLDLIGNFHFRPTARDDFQFLVTNSLFEAAYGDNQQRAPGQPVPLSVEPCAGAVDVGTAVVGVTNNGPSYTGAEGGIAPNGATCPVGIYYSTASTQNGGGNLWHHYGGLGKLQWNHIINDHSAVALIASENFNQYIFDQTIVDSNLAQYESNGELSVGNCPLPPYLPGAPVQTATGLPTGRECAQQVHFLGNPDWEDRNSRIWSLSGKYDNDLNANDHIEIGAGHTYSNNLVDDFLPGFFNVPGTWSSNYPAINYAASYPTMDTYAYAEGDFKVHKFLLSPGLRYTYRKYSYDIDGGASAFALDPTLAFNYAAGTNDVFIGSISESASLVASEYVYRDTPPGPLNGPIYNNTSVYYCSPYALTNCGVSPQPTRTHSYNLMWEHAIGNSTSFKFGPYYNDATNVFEDYVPLTLTCNTATPPVCSYQATLGTQGLFTNSGIRKAFGMELGINHLDNRKRGLSWWISGTYDNFWTNTQSSLTTPYGVVSIPPSVTGVLLRSSLDPPLSGTITAEFNENDMHFIPQLYMQSAVTFYTGSIVGSSTTNPVQLTPWKSTGWGVFNGTLEFDVGRNRDIQVGIQGENIFNNTRPITPCTTPTSGVQSAYYAPEGLGLGCGSNGSALFDPIGGNGVGVYGNSNSSQPSSWSYQNLAQSQPLFFFFITKKI
jgi:hypothetical protein